MTQNRLNNIPENDVVQNRKRCGSKHPQRGGVMPALNMTKEFDIDARTSDAIALAVRFKCDIYTHESILKSAGIALDGDMDATILSENSKIAELHIEDSFQKENTDVFKSKSSEELKNTLQWALENEKYEMASKIRDELNQRKKS